ncbi:hypothetical protein BDC45DRAFT_563952 [Circinella umbellata]|nr:hypothetical protein BDC45DRAFT_563952 [Circinella umbellata]
MKLSFSTLLLTLSGVTFIAIVHSSAPISPVNDLQTESREGDLTAKLVVVPVIVVIGVAFAVFPTPVKYV